MPRTLKPRVAVIDFKEIGCEPERGRTIAEDLATRLDKSGQFQVTGRPEWLHILGGTAPNQESRFHPGWGAQAMTLTGADAIVLGCAYRVAGAAERVKAILLDAGGIIFASGERHGAQELARLLTSPPGLGAVRAVRLVARPVDAQVLAVHGSSLLLKTGRSSAVRQEDLLKVDRVLEAVEDPYSFLEEKIYSHLAAGIGEAEVVDCRGRFVVVRYAGDLVPRRGEEVRLTKH